MSDLTKPPSRKGNLRKRLVAAGAILAAIIAVLSQLKTIKASIEELISPDISIDDVRPGVTDKGDGDGSWLEINLSLVIKNKSFIPVHNCKIELSFENPAKDVFWFPSQLVTLEDAKGSWTPRKTFEISGPRSHRIDVGIFVTGGDFTKDGFVRLNCDRVITRSIPIRLHDPTAVGQ